MPASITTVKAMARPFSGLRAVRLAITAVITTVIGPVGSEIRLGVPPNRAANRPTSTAPQRPAAAPAPEATPKARARGRATIAAVTPPNRSPLMLVVLMWFSTRRPGGRGGAVEVVIATGEGWRGTIGRLPGNWVGSLRNCPNLHLKCPGFPPLRAKR